MFTPLDNHSQISLRINEVITCSTSVTSHGDGTGAAGLSSPPETCLSPPPDDYASIEVIQNSIFTGSNGRRSADIATVNGVQEEFQVPKGFERYEILKKNEGRSPMLFLAMRVVSMAPLNTRTGTTVWGR